MTTAISNEEYWHFISDDPLAFFDEFPIEPDDDLFPDDIDSLNPYNISIEEENEKILSSPEVKN